MVFLYILGFVVLILLVSCSGYFFRILGAIFQVIWKGIVFFVKYLLIFFIIAAIIYGIITG